MYKSISFFVKLISDFGVDDIPVFVLVERIKLIE